MISRTYDQLFHPRCWPGWAALMTFGLISLIVVLVADWPDLSYWRLVQGVVICYGFHSTWFDYRYDWLLWRKTGEVHNWCVAGLEEDDDDQQ